MKKCATIAVCSAFLVKPFESRSDAMHQSVDVCTPDSRSHTVVTRSVWSSLSGRIPIPASAQEGIMIDMMMGRQCPSVQPAEQYPLPRPRLNVAIRVAFANQLQMSFSGACTLSLDRCILSCVAALGAHLSLATGLLLLAIAQRNTDRASSSPICSGQQEQ